MNQREGLLGTRAASLMPSLIRQMSGRRRPTSVDLSIGQPSLPADREIVDRAVAEMHRTSDGYTENAGIRELRELIAAHYRLPGREAAENVIVTVGTEEGCFLAINSTIDPGDEVLIPEPIYPAYHGMVVLAAGKPVPYPIDRESGLIPSADQIARRITERTRAIVINSPSNPFGTVIPAAELKQLARLVDDHRMVAISDDVYSELVYDGSGRAPTIAQFTERAIMVNGLSKSSAFCGYRLGFIVADSAFIKQATVAHQMIVTCAPRLAQLMAIEVYRRPDLLKAHLPFYTKARERLVEVARELPADAPMFLGGGAFYAVVDISNYAPKGSLAFALDLLEKQDVVVVPGVAFGPSGDWFVRLSYAAGAEVAGEGMSRVARFIRGGS